MEAVWIVPRAVRLGRNAGQPGELGLRQLCPQTKATNFVSAGRSIQLSYWTETPPIARPLTRFGHVQFEPIRFDPAAGHYGRMRGITRSFAASRVAWARAISSGVGSRPDNLRASTINRPMWAIRACDRRRGVDGAPSRRFCAPLTCTMIVLVFLGTMKIDKIVDLFRAPSLSQSPPQNHDDHPSEARARDPSISLPSAAAIMRAFRFARFRSEPVLKEHYSPPDANQSAQKAYSKHGGTPAEFHIPVDQCDEEHSRVEPGSETVIECRYAIVRRQINAALPCFVEVVLTAHVLRLPHVPVGGESEPQAACIEPSVGRGRPCVPQVGAHRELRDVCPGEFRPAERLVAAARVGGD